MSVDSGQLTVDSVLKRVDVVAAKLKPWRIRQATGGCPVLRIPGTSVAAISTSRDRLRDLRAAHRLDVDELLALACDLGQALDAIYRRAGSNPADLVVLRDIRAIVDGVR